MCLAPVCIGVRGNNFLFSLCMLVCVIERSVCRLSCFNEWVLKMTEFKVLRKKAWKRFGYLKSGLIISEWDIT